MSGQTVAFVGCYAHGDDMFEDGDA